MKISTVLVTAASLLLASCAPSPQIIHETVGIETESEHSEINGQGIYAIHVGAAIDGIFIGGNTGSFEYNTVNHTLYNQYGNYDYKFSVSGHNAYISLAYEPADITIVDNYINYNNSAEGWAACKYPIREDYALLNYLGEDIPEECIPLKLKVVSVSAVA